MVYLNAAAGLIDASLTIDSETRSPRLRSLHYPAALEWIRIEDVLRLAKESGQPASKRALINRWPSKDDFIRDAIVHALLYRDDPAGDPVEAIPSLQLIAESESFSSGVTVVISDLVSILISHPRSFLLAHIAPLLPRHPMLAEDIRSGSSASQKAWSETYQALLTAMNLELRPDWPIEKLTLAIQLVLDGTVVRSRIQGDGVLPTRWEAASLGADIILAIISGALDPEQDGLAMRDWLDQRVRLRSCPR